MIINSLLTKMFGTSHDREIKKILPVIDQINSRGKELEALDDGELSKLSKDLKIKIQEQNDLDVHIVEALAIAREAADRRLGILNVLKDEVEFDSSRLDEKTQQEYEKALEIYSEEESLKDVSLSGEFYQAFRKIYPLSKWPYRMRCFDVQLIGGIVLHQGKIAEMKTGEGKTLVATLAVYLNGLTGKGVHVITTNDYLAKVGVKDNLPLYEFLGLSVGVILSGLNEEQRRNSYSADVTYGTNNEFGFDYLRDNMARNIEDCVQRELNYAIVDEVDSILIDEARTPLIISGPAEATTDKYVKCDKVIKTLHKEIHYTVDEKSRHVGLTEKGVTTCEEQLGIDNLYGDVNTEWVHHVTQALKAHVFFKRDVDYILKNREVIIVDEFTGRLMEGRRFSDGLHQAIEAKEKVPIARENQTLATITFQNYFRMYSKLSGMTGTAETESTEFGQIYNLSVVAVPTNRPMVRKDNNDLIFRSNREKLNAIAEDIKERHQAGQPVLVGTVSIEKSEEVGKALTRAGVEHDVLNAKQHEKEALIIEQAGQKGKITIATNMAGRGVDIKLGPGVLDAGGLYVLGTERHESRRIDNQLRGRSGRQGDPGESQFYLCLEDDLMRIFGSERIGSIMDKLGAEEGEVITHPLVNRAIANAQKRVEGQNFEIRKHLLEYDDVMNKQRTVVYKVRRKILKGEEIKNEIEGRLEDAVDILVSNYASESEYPESWNLDGFYAEVKKSFGIDYSIAEEDLSTTSSARVVEILTESVLKKYQETEEAVGSKDLREIERQLLLMVIDHYWKEHLYSMDHLKEAIRFRGYAQKDPLQEYKREGLSMFESTLDRIALATSERFMHIDTDFIVKQKEALAQRAAEYEQAKKDQVQQGATGEGSFAGVKAAAPASGAGPGAQSKPSASPIHVAEKVGRNDPCPCGSGKKYKKCHGVGN